MDCDERDKRPPQCKEFRPKATEEDCHPPPPEESEPHSRSFKLPSLSSKHIEIVKNFWPSLAVYTLALLASVVYVTDWKVVVGKLPYYSGKFEEKDAKEK